MRCPKCGSEHDRVIDSRSINDDSGVRRRRECLDCSYRFTTMEEIVPEELRVIKRNGEREEYDRNKVRNGIANACYKRPISAETIDRIVDDITRSLVSACTPEVSTSEIGAKVMDELKNLDQVAYVRFASVYRQFKDAKDFISEVKGLKK